MHKVSVILPIYNVENYLEKCLSSVINQTYKNLEIICVNDCSPDNSLNIIKSFQQLDSRIILVDRKQNGGLSAARNSGLDVAKGEYIYFLDSDDYIDKDYIEKMVNAAIRSGAEVVLNTSIKAETKEKSSQHFKGRTYNDISHEFIDAKPAILNIIWNTWAHLWKKSFLDKINARFPEGYIIEDQYFQAITYIHLKKIYVIRESLYHYIIRETSIIGKLKSDSFYTNLKILNKIFDYYEDNNLFGTLKNVRMITDWILPEYNDKRKEQLEELKKYFTRIERFVNQNQTIYKKSELALFNDVLYHPEKAMTINYFNLFVFEKLRKNIQTKKEGVNV